MSFNKNGIISSDKFIDGTAGNILQGNTFPQENPFILGGKSTDIYDVTYQFAKVTPGKKYYLTAKSSTSWATKHFGDQGTANMWLYLSTSYDPEKWAGYNLPAVFSKDDAYWVDNGIWLYQIPSGYNMASIRVNTYSNGTDQVTVKFWDINLIPEEDFTPPPSRGMRILDKQITTRELVEY